MDDIIAPVVNEFNHCSQYQCSSRPTLVVIGLRAHCVL